LARPKDEFYKTGYDIQWNTLENGSDRAIFEKKVNRLVVSSLLGSDDRDWNEKIKTYQGANDNALDKRDAQHYLTLMVERFEVDKNRGEIRLKNVFGQIYRSPHMPVLSRYPGYGLVRIHAKKVDSVWKDVLIHSVKALEVDPRVKRINDLGKLILNKIGNSYVLDQEYEMQWNNLVEFAQG
jgi:hypothetical protein